MKYEEILKEIQQKKYKPIYFLQGEETFFIDEIAHYLEKNVLSEDQKSFNFLTLYGKDTDAETIVATARRYPVMSDYQLLMVREAHELKQLDKLQKYAENPLNSTVLVFLHKYKTLDGRGKLAKTLNQKGFLLEFSKLYDNQIMPWVQHYLKTKHYTIEPPALQLITEHIGNDLATLANELGKIMLNVPNNQTITTQHIADNVGISKEYNVFELQKALAIKNITQTYKITNYFAQNPKAAPLVVIIGSLFRFFSRLYLFHYCYQQPEADIMKNLDLKFKFALQEYREALKHYNLLRTKRIISILHQYDLKSKGIDNVFTTEAELLREMVAKILM